MNFGVVYAVMRSAGGRYMEEAIQSANSLRKHNSNMPIQLVTDEESRPSVPKDSPFDTITVIGGRLDKRLVLQAKIDALAASVFERTMFLDTDTYVCGRIRGAFQVLDFYEVAMVFAPRRVDPEWKPKGDDIPPWLPEFNSGMVLLRRSDNTARFLAEWKWLYGQYGKWNDQIALRVALFHGLRYGLKLYAMPTEYNVRTICMAQLGAKALILHGRGDMQKMCGQVNSGVGFRVFIPDVGVLRRKDWKHVKTGSKM